MLGPAWAGPLPFGGPSSFVWSSCTVKCPQTITPRPFIGMDVIGGGYWVRASADIDNWIRCLIALTGRVPDR